mmetsp:Transcript_65789/g.104168  ORF Transcript_65789/g.104168 Transcript_65789/m.104168 type:complete len:668 (-) Transcript_65789:370-2373(-)
MRRRVDKSSQPQADYAFGEMQQGHGNNRGNAPVSPLEELMRRKGVDDAWMALEEMQKQNLTTDRFTVSRMLMKTVGDGKHRMNPAKVYKGLYLVERFIQYQPDEADEVLFNALLDTCCRIKDLARLESTVQRMRELQIPPSHVTLGILVKAYGQAGDINKVLQVWEEMGDQRRQANAVTYGCMIDACVKCGHMEKAMEIFYDMKRRRKHRNTILYTTLIKGCGLEKNLRTALTLFREMHEEGVPYNTITYNSIIDVCIKCADVQSAEELLREMLAPGSQLEPDLITYSTLLKGYCHVGDLDKALQVAETIKACGLKCDELVYNTLMDGCVKANDLSAGIGLFAEMTQGGMRPSSITHSILVRLYQRNGYKGDCFDAVGQLYQHHGLDRPSGPMERGGKGSSKNDKRGDRKERNNQQNNGSRDHSGGNHLLPNGGMNGVLNMGQGHGMDSIQGWDPSMSYPGHPGPLGMPPPHMAAGYHHGGLPPHPHLMGGHDPSLLASREGDLDPYGAHGGLQGLPYGMSMEALQGRGPHNMSGMDADRGMGLYLPPRNQQPPLGGPNGPMPWQYNSASSSQLGVHTGSNNSLAAPHASMGANLRRYPRGNNGVDASRQCSPSLDQNLLQSWNQGGIPDMPYPVSGAYLDRMNGLPDGRPPLVGVQCGGPVDFEGY